MATYAIGDVHGCFLTLKKLIEVCNITDDDKLIFLGDLVDRGPRIKETLDFVLTRPNTEILLGNHDECFIDWFRPGGTQRSYFMVHQGLGDTLSQLGSEAEIYAKKLSKYPYVIHTSNKEYVMCHADYNWAEEKFSKNLNGHIWNRINEYSHAKYKGPVILHGHTPCPLSEVYEKKCTGELFGINLDGGCVHFRNYDWSCLRMIRLEDRQIFEQSNVEYS